MSLIDGVEIGARAHPATVDELAAMVAAGTGSVVPSGAGTQSEFGNPLRSADCVLDMTGLSRITEYNPADLTIHVQAGITLGALQNALNPNKQLLPIEPWHGPETTIGGLTATNAAGPFRALGTIRDWIIGMKVVHADGRISKTGGKVVKNVTGYDLAKLYAGSLGTLGIIAEISLKLRAAFPRTATAIAEFGSLNEAAVVLASLRKGILAPICCELSGPRHALWLRFGEHPRAVDWQLAQLPAADWKFFEGEEEAAVWQELGRRVGRMGPLVLRVVTLPSEIPALISTFRPSQWVSHALNGVTSMVVDGADVVENVRERFPAVIEKAPLEVRRTVGTFGVRGLERQLIRDMKNALDPGHRLNPGRHLDGE